MDRMEYTYCLLQVVNKYTLPMEYEDFGSLFCMIAEDYCKSHKLDVRDFMQDATSMVYQVYNELGEY